jgi:equilibrative nucleoside transporter 1/2/3
MSDEDVESRSSTASDDPAPAAAASWPPDRFHLTYCITFLAGMGTLLPWNVFITERAYFDLRLFVPPYAPAVADEFESVFGMTFMAANVLGLALLVRGDALSRVPRFMRVPAPLLAMGVLLAVSGALVRARGVSGDALAGVTLLTLVCLGGLTALVQGGSFADASCLPPKYNQALMGGQAAAGVASAAAALATTAASSHSHSRRGGDDDFEAGEKGIMTQASTYFYASACLMLVCALGCAFAARLPFFERGMEAAAAAKRETDETVAAERAERAEGGSNLDSLSTSLVESLENADANVPLLRGARGEGEEVETPGPIDASSRGSFLASSARGTSLCYRFAVFATFAVTLTVFPAVTSSVCAAENGATSPPCLARPAGGGSRFAGDLWTPSLFLLFNAFDLAGRAVASVAPRRAPSGQTVVLASLARVALIPPLLACNVVTSRRWAFPGWFARSDAAPVVLVAALAFTNGHLGSASMMWGPTVRPLGRRAEEGAALSFALTAGLGFGSLASYALVAAMQR